MKKSSVALAAGLLCAVFAAPVLAAEPAAAVDSQRELPAAMAVAGVQLTAIVDAVDLENRLVTLRTEDGEVMLLAVSEEARNLPQVQVGDRVVVTYQIGLALELSPADGASGIREREETVTLDRAELGQKPGGELRKTTRVKGVVRALDAKARTVTLQGAEHTLKLEVAKDVDLSSIKVGDQVNAVYQESIALRVESAPPAAGK